MSNDQKPKPYAGTSKERMLALFNASLEEGSSPISIDDFYIASFGIPNSNVSEGFNSFVEITDEANVRKSTIHLYNRLDLSVINELDGTAKVGDVMVYIPQNEFVWTHDILPDINDALGLNLLPSEVYNLESISGVGVEHILRIKNSPAWLPNSQCTYTLRMAW